MLTISKYEIWKKQATCWLDLPDNESTNERANEGTNEETNEKAIPLMFLCEKNNEICGKSPKKSAETVISGIFPAFSAGKNVLKNWPQSYFGHCYYASLCKKSGKTNDEISRKCQKTGFSGKFPAFSAGKNMFFENRALSHFIHSHFASVCKISWKNVKYSSRNSRNAVFPAKIGCSGDF